MGKQYGMGLIFAMALFVAAGCSKPTTFPVSGTVTMDGQPLPEGYIYFKNIDTGMSEAIDIKNGEFHGIAKGGDRRVEIYQLRTITKEISGMKTDIKQNLVPKKYNTDSTLTAKVTPEGPNKFSFELKNK